MKTATDVFLISRHAARRWKQWVPAAYQSMWFLLRAIRLGTLVREQGTRQYVFHCGMLIVLDDPLVISCWPIASRKADAWRQQFLGG